MKKDDKWQDNPWLEWAEKFPVEIVYNKPTKESLILTTYDSMGTPIMRYTFDNVSVRHAGSRFDYEAVDCSIIKLMCNYDTVKREFVYA